MPTSKLAVVREGKKVTIRLGGPITPAYKEVAARIRRAIDRGTIHSGDQLPSENSLAEVLEVSRDTVRRGLVLLGPEGEGLLTGEQGRGWIVR